MYGGANVDAVLARARELFSDVDVRMYLAAVTSRLQQRAPFGGRKSVSLNGPTLLAKNDSKARALRVDLEWFSGPPVFVSDSPDAGTNNFTTASNNLPAGFGETYVLRPDEQLFATPFGGGVAAVLVGQEWF